MATGIGDVGAALVKNTVADKVVYGKKREDDDDAVTVVKQKDFYWDQIALVLVSAMLGLSFLEISIEFFRGSEVKCFVDIDNFTESKGEYINSYCYGSLPNTQYYLVFILITGLIIIAPHYLWSAYYAAQFDFFFDLVRKLDRLRDTNTGEYRPHNFARVRKLEDAFKKSQIFISYKLKLLFQLFICLAALLLNIGFFQDGDFNPRFDCPKNCALDGDGNQSVTKCSDLQWPLNERFHCVYNSFTLLYFLHKTMYGLLVLIIIVLVIGLIWSSLSRHANQLGAKRVADFCFHSCLHPEAFSFTSWKTLLTKCRYLDLSSAQFINSFNPRIENDLDFLLIRLFTADSGHGQVFRDIQISNHFRTLVSFDLKHLCRLNLIDASRFPALTPYNTLEAVTDIQQLFYRSGFERRDPKNADVLVYQYIEPIVGAQWKPKHSIRDVIFGFFQFAPRNRVAMGISFGTSTSYSLELARAFYNVATVHFNQFYKNPEQNSRIEKVEADIQTITVQEDIISQIANKSEDVIKKWFSFKDSIDLILIGPMNNTSMIDTTAFLIGRMHFSECFTEKLALIAVRPLKIGLQNRVDDFLQFRPSQENCITMCDRSIEFKLHSKALFDDITESEECKVSGHHGIHFVEVESSTCEECQMDKRMVKGVLVDCNGVECIFEFRVFRYTGGRQNSSMVRVTLPGCSPTEFGNGFAYEKK